MKRVVFVIVHACSKRTYEDPDEECPFLSYDADYGMTYDSGWDCHHPDTWGKRIIDDSEYSAQKNHDGPRLLDDYPPKWCPLLGVDNEVVKKVNDLLQAARSRRTGDNSNNSVSKDAE
jgi:hypothetical protein